MGQGLCWPDRASRKVWCLRAVDAQLGTHASGRSGRQAARQPEEGGAAALLPPPPASGSSSQSPLPSAGVSTPDRQTGAHCPERRGRWPREQPLWIGSKCLHLILQIQQSTFKSQMDPKELHPTEVTDPRGLSHDHGEDPSQQHSPSVPARSASMSTCHGDVPFCDMPKPRPPFVQASEPRDSTKHLRF